MYLTELLDAAVLLPDEYDEDNTVVLLKSGLLPWVDEPMGVSRSAWEEVYNKYRQSEPDCEIFFSGILSGKLDMVIKQLAVLAPVRDTYIRLHEPETTGEEESVSDESSVEAGTTIPESEDHGEMDTSIKPVMAPVMQDDMFSPAMAQDDFAESNKGIDTTKFESGGFDAMFSGSEFEEDHAPEVNDSVLRDPDEMETPAPAEASAVADEELMEDNVSAIVASIRSNKSVNVDELSVTGQQCAATFLNMISDFGQIFESTSMNVVLAASNMTAEQLHYAASRLVPDAGAFFANTKAPTNEGEFVELLWEVLAQAVQLCYEEQVETAVSLAKIFASIIYES